MARGKQKRTEGTQGESFSERIWRGTIVITNGIEKEGSFYKSLPVVYHYIASKVLERYGPKD